MSTMSVNWEERLLKIATPATSHQVFQHLPAGHDYLPTAYAHCREITRLHSRTFFLASGLLDPDARQAARALYAFCRISDDIVDHGGADARQELQAWRQESLLEHPQITSPVALAWADTLASRRIPRHYAEQLLDGVAQDLAVARYQSFDDLVFYCYGVASTVGLMSMHIIGFETDDAIAYAIKLGVALQLTNILRDVREDWENGRLYLPLDELAAFGLTEADIAAGRVDDRWRSFMRFQIGRARQLYTEAGPGIALLDRSGRFAIAAAADLYAGILDDIEEHDYDVFTRRARVTGLEKLLRIPRIWWRARFGRYSKIK